MTLVPGATVEIPTWEQVQDEIAKNEWHRVQAQEAEEPVVGNAWSDAARKAASDKKKQKGKQPPPAAKDQVDDPRGAVADHCERTAKRDVMRRRREMKKKNADQ